MIVSSNLNSYFRITGVYGKTILSDGFILKVDVYLGS